MRRIIAPEEGNPSSHDIPPSSGPPGRFVAQTGGWHWLLFISLLFVLPMLIFFSSPIPHVLSMGLVEDDAFYYLQIAAHITSGQGSTFDGLIPTNGYHPLWLVCLLPLYLLQKDPVLAFRLACMLSVLLYLAAAVVAYLLFRKAFQDLSATALGLMTTCSLIFFSSNYCMETPLVVFVTWGTLLYLVSKDPLSPGASPRSEWCLGSLLAVVFLSRLDMVFLAMVVFGFAIIRGVREGASPAAIAKKLFRLSVPCLVIPAPYLAWNLSTFGKLVPISGFLKSSFPRFALHSYVLKSLGPHVLFAIGVGVLLILKIIVSRSGRRTPGTWGQRERTRAALALLAVTILIQVLYSLLFEKWGFAHWQMAPSFLLAGFGIAWMVEALSVLARKWVGPRLVRFSLTAAVLLAVPIAVGAGTLLRLLPFAPDSFYVHEWEAARWTQEHLPRDAVFAAKADAGLFAYFCGRKVININDGLVSDFAYQEVVKEGRLRSYLSEKGVGWLFVAVNPARVLNGRLGIRAYSHRYDTYSDEISLDVAAASYRSPLLPVDWGSGQIYLAIAPFPRPGELTRSLAEQDPL